MGFPYIPFLSKRTKKPAFRPGWLVVAQDEYGLRCLHIVYPPGEKPRVLSWESLPAGGDIVQQIRGLSQVGKLKRFRCLVTLKPDEYQIVQAELPAVPADELRQALRWGIRELVDYPVEDVGVDYIDMPYDKNRGSVGHADYVVCARRAGLSRYVGAFAAVKACLHVCDVPETAHRNLAALCGVEGKGVALLGVTNSYSLLTFTLEGELCMARRIDVGLMALQGADAAQRAQLCDRILLEVQRSQDAFEREFHFVSLSGLLVSPLPDSIDLMPFLVDNLDIKVSLLDLTELIDFSAVKALAEPAQLTAFLTLLGAGLRSEDAIEVA